MKTTLTDIEDFLANKRLAVVGLSRNPKDFSHAVFRELSSRGYDLVPVNPFAKELAQKRCFARVQDIAPTVDGALLMTSPAETEQAVKDCAEAGIRRVWMHGGVGQGAVSQSAVEFCRQNNIRLVEGYCPLMFLRDEAYIHRAHRSILKLVGRYPTAT
jgi:predicted CoA-binding protein